MFSIPSANSLLSNRIALFSTIRALDVDVDVQVHPCMSQQSTPYLVASDRPSTASLATWQPIKGEIGRASDKRDKR